MTSEAGSGPLSRRAAGGGVGVGAKGAGQLQVHLTCELRMKSWDSKSTLRLSLHPHIPSDNSLSHCTALHCIQPTPTPTLPCLARERVSWEWMVIDFML